MPLRGSRVGSTSGSVGSRLGRGMRLVAVMDTRSESESEEGKEGDEYRLEAAGSASVAGSAFEEETEGFASAAE